MSRTHAWLLGLAGLAALLAAPAAMAQTRFQTPDWYIDLTDAGYSDFVIMTRDPFPARSLHEMLSGEWAAAISYDGLDAQLTPPQRAMWLESNWEYPDWLSNSTFTPTVSFNPQDTDGDGLPEATSLLDNGEVEITIRVDVQDTITGTPIGVRGPTALLSNRYVMLVTYEVRNLTTGPLTNVRLFQFVQAHPANSEAPVVQATYDPTFYSGALSNYQYDITHQAQNSGDASGAATGCSFNDHVSMAARVSPSAWGLGPYRGHTSGKPASGLHLDTENDTLLNQTSFGPDESAGTLRVTLGNLASGDTKSAQFLLAVRSVNVTPGRFTNSACASVISTGADPLLVVRKGACTGAQTSGPIDVITGDPRALAEVTGTIESGRVTCVANDLPLDRVTVTDTMDATCVSSRFILVRRGNGLQADWGKSSGGAARISTEGACP